MKKIFIILLVAGIITGACNQQKSEEAKNTESTTPSAQTSTDVIANPATESSQPVDESKLAAITFDRYEHNFGKVEEGKVVETVFKFTNTGANDLIISDAKGSCGCTVPYFPKEPIKPGQSGEIKVSYDSKGKSGIQNKTVTITANTNPSVTTLNIVTEVIPAAEASKK
jgi:hypothetical protein